MEAMERDHPADPRARISVATSYSNLAFHLTRKKDTAGAKDYYRRAIGAFAALAARLPQPASTQYAFALKRLGAILIVEGALDEAEQHYRRALELDEQAIRRDPQDSRLRYDMTFSLSDLALIARKGGDYASAEALYRRVLEIRERAVAADPVDRRALNGLANTRLNLGEALRLQKKFAEADPQYRGSLKLRQQIVRLAGPAPANLIALADTERCLSVLLLDQAEAMGAQRRQRVEEALRLLANARAIAEVKANRAMYPKLPAEVVEQSRRAERQRRAERLARRSDSR